MGRSSDCYRKALSRGRTVAAGLVLTAIMPACATRTDLTPAPQAWTMAPETVVSRVGGVHMVVESDAWHGHEDVATHVTPIRIRIENEGSREVRVDYRDFALVAPDGSRYAALPLHEVEGGITEPVIVRNAPPVTEPVFRYGNFRIAPYSAPAYPGVPVYAGPYYTDPYYADHYYDYWIRTELPTALMLQEALPPDVIEPGGHVNGFLFFERVDSAHERVVFRADLVQARDGRHYGEIRIPFTVHREPVGD